MLRLVAYLAVAALAIFNGVYSPRTFVVFALQGIWWPSFLPAPLTLMLVLAGIISSLLHAIIAGIPVAIIEHVRPDLRRSTASACVWLAFLLVPAAIVILPWLSNRGT